MTNTFSRRDIAAMCLQGMLASNKIFTDDDGGKINTADHFVKGAIGYADWLIASCPDEPEEDA